MAGARICMVIDMGRAKYLLALTPLLLVAIALAALSNVPVQTVYINPDGSISLAGNFTITPSNLPEGLQDYLVPLMSVIGEGTVTIDIHSNWFEIKANGESATVPGNVEASSTGVFNLTLSWNREIQQNSAIIDRFNGYIYAGDGKGNSTTITFNGALSTYVNPRRADLVVVIKLSGTGLWWKIIRPRLDTYLSEPTIKQFLYRIFGSAVRVSGYDVTPGQNNYRVSVIVSVDNIDKLYPGINLRSYMYEGQGTLTYGVRNNKVYYSFDETIHENINKYLANLTTFLLFNEPYINMFYPVTGDNSTDKYLDQLRAFTQHYEIMPSQGYLKYKNLGHARLLVIYKTPAFKLKKAGSPLDTLKAVYEYLKTIKYKYADFVQLLVVANGWQILGKSNNGWVPVKYIMLSSLDNYKAVKTAPTQTTTTSQPPSTSTGTPTQSHAPSSTTTTTPAPGTTTSSSTPSTSTAGPTPSGQSSDNEKILLAAIIISAIVVIGSAILLYLHPLEKSK